MKDEQDEFIQQEQNDQKHWANDDEKLPHAEDNLNSFGEKGEHVSD
jgi:hypothetical protein